LADHSQRLDHAINRHYGPAPMEADSKKPNRLHSYFAGLVREINRVNQRIAAISKFFLEMLRNFLFVVALKYCSTKSDGRVLSFVAMTAFAGCYFHYIYTLRIDVFHSLAKRQFSVGWWLNSIVCMLVLLAFVLAANWAVDQAMSALMPLQGK
jgi:hypothetical protein